MYVNNIASLSPVQQQFLQCTQAAVATLMIKEEHNWGPDLFSLQIEFIHACMHAWAWLQDLAKDDRHHHCNATTKGRILWAAGCITVEEDAACSLTKTLLRKRVSTTMTVDNVTILGWQKYLVNLLPSCTCDCSLLISVGCKSKSKPKPKSRSEVKSRFLQKQI